MMDWKRKQKVSLWSFTFFRWAAPVGCSALHSTDHLPPKIEPLENEKLFFCCLHSQSANALFRLSLKLPHPQHSFISFLSVNYDAFNSAVLCLSLHANLAVALITCSWGGSTPLCPCMRYANAVFMFSPTKRSKYFTSLRKLRSVPIPRLQVICRNTASCSSKNSIKIPFSCGTAGRLRTFP